MADFSCQPEFGRQMPVVAAPRALQSDASAQLFVKGLVDDPHPALGDAAHNTEAIGEKPAGGDRGRRRLAAGACRI